MTTYSQSELKSAIEYSISHNEIVRVQIVNPYKTLAEIDLIADDETMDSVTENSGIEDVWGTKDGNDFRLRLIKV